MINKTMKKEYRITSFINRIRETEAITLSKKVIIDNTFREYFRCNKILYRICFKSKTNPKAKFKKIYNLLKEEDFIRISLTEIRTNKGMNTPGIEKTGLDEFSMKMIDSIQEDIKERKYKFSPVRRIMIPKPRKDEKRPLGQKPKVFNRASLGELHGV